MDQQNLSSLDYSCSYDQNKPNMSSSPMHKMQLKMQHQQRLRDSNQNARSSSSAHVDPFQKIGSKAMSEINLSLADQLENMQLDQNEIQQKSLMLPQQKLSQNHPKDQQMFQQITHKASLSQLMKVGPNHNASLADFRSIIASQPINDIHASQEQLNAIVNAQKHSDYIVSDYMDKIQTRIALLETELKFADRKLQVMFAEYTDMHAKIEKLENLTIAQHSVLANLMSLCSHNQTKEFSNAKELQEKASSLLAMDPQALYNPMEQYGEQMVDNSHNEFHAMLEDMKNEAIIDGSFRSMQSSGIQVPIDDYSSDIDHVALMAYLNEEQSNQERFELFKSLMMNQAERQKLFEESSSLDLMKNLTESTLNKNENFFRSGEVNKNLFSTMSASEHASLGPSSLQMIFEDNEDKGEVKDTSSPKDDKTKEESEGDSLSLSKKDINEVGASRSDSRKSKTKRKKHHQHLQQEHLQLQQSDDPAVGEIVDEILKIENMTDVLQKDHLDELRFLVKTNLKYFENFRKLDKNFLLLLLNSDTELKLGVASLSVSERFQKLMEKLKRNIEMMKKMAPSSDKNLSTKSLTSSSLYSDDEYFQSLKQSLERHNSMQLLLHIQNPNLKAKSPSSVLDLELASSNDFENDDGSSSPPPPAPNGGGESSCYVFKSDNEEPGNSDQEWNPFHSDVMTMMRDPRKKDNETLLNLSPYRFGQRSPKHPKSDSGLSSMSGFSSFEKSPISPSNLTFEPNVNLRQNIRNNQEYIRFLSSQSGAKLAHPSQPHTSQFYFSDIPQVAHQNVTAAATETIFTEENLNYIKELSQNIPICSVIENKSIFDSVSSMNKNNPLNMPINWNNSQKSLNVNVYPDLIVNQDEARASSLQSRLDMLQDEKKLLSQQKMQLKQQEQLQHQQRLLQQQQQLQQKNRKSESGRPKSHLTDHLNFYPSSSSITDYNSSMNLEYQREFATKEKAYHPQQQQKHPKEAQHDEFMQHTHGKYQQHSEKHSQEARDNSENMAAIRGRAHSTSSEKSSYINKVHSWLEMPTKLKKFSKRNRSNSLPGEVETDEAFAKQSYKMGIKKMGVNHEHESDNARHGKKKEVYVMKSYMKGKKKQIAHTMTNIMNKAKVYRRHSFSHSVSDDDENQTTQQSSPSSYKTPRYQQNSSKKSFSDTETDISSAFSDNDDVADNNAAMSLFAMIGETSQPTLSAPQQARNSDTGDSDTGKPSSDYSASSNRKSREIDPEMQTAEGGNSFNLNFTSTSMEFAASRKVGMLRKKGSVSDEQSQQQPQQSNQSNFQQMSDFVTMMSPSAEDEVRDEADEQFGGGFQRVSIKKRAPPPQIVAPLPETTAPTLTTTTPHMLSKTHSIFVDSIDDEKSVNEKDEEPSVSSVSPRPPVPSPRLGYAARSVSIRGGNSLDIPGKEDEGDTRSQHSFRSSRRQSTEENSIDTDDEYFQYEMRNLEELERNSHMESILQDDRNEVINNIIKLDQSFERCEHEPDASVKQMMEQVLRELKVKVKSIEAHDDSIQDEFNNNKKSKKKNVYEKFTMASNIQDMPWNRDSDDDGEYDDHMEQINQLEMEMNDANYGKVKRKRKKVGDKIPKYSPSSSEDDEDDFEKSLPSSSSPPVEDYRIKGDRHSQSSGVTSGPDSPMQSDDDAGSDGTSDHMHVIKSQKNEQLLDQTVQPPEKQEKDRGAPSDEKLASMGAAVEAETLEKSTNENAKPSMKKLMQLSSTISTDSTNQDSGISETSGGPVMGSKWKLLKTLKERKEMTSQGKIKEEDEHTSKKTVS